MSEAPPPSYQESTGGQGQGYGTQPPGYKGPPYPQAPQQPPQGGYQQGYGYQQIPSYQQQSAAVVQQQPQILVVGGCPACRIGVLEDDFTCLGVCCAILFFPIGILCCLAMKQRRCPNCGAVFG